MALSLAQSVLHYNNPLSQGVAMDMIEVSPVLGMIPFMAIDGNAYTHKFQNNWAGAAYVDVNAAIPAGAKTDAEIDRLTFNIKSIIGEATVDGLVQATGVSASQDPMAYQIRARAKSLARRHSKAMVDEITLGAGEGTAINSLNDLLVAGQDMGAAGALDLDSLRELFDLVLSKDGAVDACMIGRKGRRKILALADAAGGRTAEYTLWTNPYDGSTRQVLRVEGVPFIVNDHLDESADIPVFAFNLDDGSKETGLAFLHPSASAAGIVVEAVGKSATHDADIVRVKQYTELALFNRKGLAKATFSL